MFRRITIGLLIFFAFLVTNIVSAAGHNDPNSAAKIKFLAVSSSLTSTPFLAAYANGMYKDAGLDLGSPLPLFQGGSTKVVKALLAGQGDFATTGAAPLLYAIAAGAQVKIIAQMEGEAVKMVLSKSAAERIKQATGVTQRSSIADKVRALKGLKIATTPAGNQFYTILVMLLNRYGVNANEVTLLPAQTSTVAKGVIAGKFDGAFWGVGALYQAISGGDGVEWINLMTEHIPGISDFPLTYIFTTDKKLKDDPATVQKLVDATRQAAKKIISDPDSVMPAIREKWYPTTPPATWKVIWKDVPKVVVPDQKIARGDFVATVQALEKATGKDLSRVTYENAVASIAQK